MLVLGAPAVVAHDYWIAPEKFRVAPGERIEARLLVGEMMEGSELPWLSHQIRSFVIATPKGVSQVEGIEGDLPALSHAAEVPGLYVIAHETFPLEVTFDTLEDFRGYLDYEGLSAVIDEHRRRALPETAISETYVRSAKALVQVGSVTPEGSDHPLGLPYEFVALENPYSENGGALSVRLMWQGSPAAGVPVAIHRATDKVERSFAITDTDGQVEIAIAGGGEFLLTSVHLEPVNGKKHVWESTWASLTFNVVARK